MNGPDALVLVVDDDVAVRRSLVRLLGAAGYRVEALATAGELLARDPPPGPACVVLDVRLPDLDGLELQRQLAAGEQPLPIVFITGHGDIPMSVRAMKAGAVDFLPKPFAADALLAAVAQALARCRRERQVGSERGELQRRLARLSPREREVFGRVVVGELNKHIAAELGINERTVKRHRARVMAKMRAASLAELARQAEKLGLAGGLSHCGLPPKGQVPKGQSALAQPGDAI